MQLPGILHKSVQEPEHDGIVTLLATNLDPQVVDFLVLPVHPSHAGFVPLVNVRLRHV